MLEVREAGWLLGPGHAVAGAGPGGPQKGALGLGRRAVGIPVSLQIFGGLWLGSSFGAEQAWNTGPKILLVGIGRLVPVRRRFLTPGILGSPDRFRADESVHQPGNCFRRGMEPIYHSAAGDVAASGVAGGAFALPPDRGCRPGDAKAPFIYFQFLEGTRWALTPAHTPARHPADSRKKGPWRPSAGLEFPHHRRVVAVILLIVSIRAVPCETWTQRALPSIPEWAWLAGRARADWGSADACAAGGRRAGIYQADFEKSIGP